MLGASQQRFDSRLYSKPVYYILCNKALNASPFSALQNMVTFVFSNSVKLQTNNSTSKETQTTNYAQFLELLRNEIAVNICCSTLGGLEHLDLR